MRPIDFFPAAWYTSAMRIYYTPQTVTGEALISALQARGILPDKPLLRMGAGKPYFAGGPEIGVTHTKGLSAIAVGDFAIGLDAERRREAPPPNIFARLTPAEREEDFFRLWTAKEAYIKLRGGTLAAMLPALTFRGALFEEGHRVGALAFFELFGCVLCLCTDAPTEAELVCL